MPPASAVNNNNNSNNNAVNNALKQERLRGALKAFIQKERQRKKEEFEAKVEEERLRKEREARERQTDMTLEETRGQIAKLDQKLTELRNQKQQLFLQLKKVLNEDENRKKQQKDNEMFALQALQAQQANAPQPQVFIPPVRVEHHQAPIISKPSGNSGVKRGRSPSPPTHQVYYKTAGYAQPKHDDGRRSADYARVLWNKPPSQYQNPGTLFYQTSNSAPPTQSQDTRGPAITYSAYNLPLRQGYPIELQPSTALPVTTKTDPQNQKPPPTQVYHINLDQPRTSQSPAGGGQSNDSKKSITMKKIGDHYYEVKMDNSKVHGAPPPPHQLHEPVYTSIMPPGISLHPNVMQITGNPNQSSKSGASITQGYAPGRGHASAHEQQLARQQTMPVLQGQPGQQSQQPLHYIRRMYN